MSAPAPPRGAAARRLALGRVLRLSLAPTAAADALAGMVLGGGGRLPGLVPTAGAVAGAVLLYEAGLVLNDWRDREADAHTRPDRPIPSGALPAGAALLLGLGLLAGGIAAVAVCAPAALPPALVVAAALVAYDLGPRGPWLGPVLLGLCRGGDLALGGFAGAAGLPDPAFFAAPLLYGAYVVVVSRLGRLEDAVDGPLDPRRPPRLLAGAALLLLAPAALPGDAPLVARLGALALGALAASGLLHRAFARRPSTAGEVGAAMGLALRRLLVLTAAFALGAGPPHGPPIAAAILLAYPLSRAMARAFPPS